MMIFVVSIGTLLSVRPQELVAVAHSEQDISINRFLVLIAGMSVIDLTWTLLAHQANQINEVNPVGNVLLGDALRTIVFKGLATGMAIIGVSIGLAFSAALLAGPVLTPHIGVAGLFWPDAPISLIGRAASWPPTCAPIAFMPSPPSWSIPKARPGNW